MPSPLSQRDRLSGRTTKTQAARRRPRRLTPAVLEYLEPRTLLTLSATITGTTSTFVDSTIPTGGTLQVPSPVTPINANLTNNQFNVGNPGFVDAFDFDSLAPGSNHLATATTSTVVLSVAGKAADYTFQIGPSSSPLLAGFQFIGGTQHNTMVLDYTSGDPIAGGGAVSFSALTGTNVLRVIDPAGTYTTATYNVATDTFTFGGHSILVSAANLTLDLSGTKITSLNVTLPATPNTLGLSRATAAPTAPDQLTIQSGLETNTVLYPSITSPVTMTGGSATDTLTVDLGNGNPLPPDTGPGSGLVLSPTATTTVTYQNGAVTDATLDLAANTLTLDGGVVRYPSFAPVDLTAIDVANVSLHYSSTYHAVTLEQVASTARPFRFHEGATTLMTFPAVTGQASVVGFAGATNDLTVDYNNAGTIPGNPIPALGGLFFDGQGSGRLTVTGTDSNANLQSVAYTATGPAAGRLVIDNGTPTTPVVRTINFISVFPVIVSTPSLGTLSVDITAVFSGATVTATAFPGDRVELTQGLAWIYYTHPANLVLGATGGDASNTYEYRLVGFSNNVTVNGNAGTMKVYAARDLASNPNTGTLTVFGGSGNATLNLDISRGDPIPAAGGVTFWGGSANNTLAVINPAPSGPPMAVTNIHLHGPSPANWTELDFGGGRVNAYGLNQATDLTDSAGVTDALNVWFADYTNAIGVAVSGANSLISLNGAPLVLFKPGPGLTTSVTLFGGTGCDTLIVDYATRSPLPSSFVFDDSLGGSCPGGVCGDGSGLTVINVSGSAKVDAAAQTVTVGGSTIGLNNVLSVNLSGSFITDLTVDLPASSTEETLSVACKDPVTLKETAKLVYNTNYTLFYPGPSTTTKVTLNGGAVSNTLTVDLGNGNPVPAGPTLGLIASLADLRNFKVVNGLVQQAELDVSKKTLAIDTGLVWFNTLSNLAIDLTKSAVLTVKLDLSGNATLSQTTDPGHPLQFTLDSVSGFAMKFANSTPFVTVDGLAGDNVLTLDYVNNGVPLPTAKLSFTAETGALNTLVVKNATLTTAEYTVDGAGPNTNTLRLDSGLVTLVSPKKVSLDGTTNLTNVIVNLANVVNDVQLNSESGGLNRIGLGANDLIAFKTPTNATVNGGNLADTYTLSAGFAAPLVINDMSGSANKFVIDFGGQPGGLPAVNTTYRGTGGDTIVGQNGSGLVVTYTATSPGAGVLKFTGAALTFTGIAGSASDQNLPIIIPRAIDLTDAGLASLKVSVTDGVAHTYNVDGSGVSIDQGMVGVAGPLANQSLTVVGGPGDDRFLVNAQGFQGPNYSFNGGGGADVMTIDSGGVGLTETANDDAGRTGTIAAVGGQFTINLTGSGVPTVIGLSFRVTNKHDSGLGSLRSAIVNSNQYPGHTIDSNKDANNPYIISPLTPLPALTTQMTFTGTGMTLDGANRPGNGLQFDSGASGSTISGITLTNFGGSGLYLNQASWVKLNQITASDNGNSGLSLYQASGANVQGGTFTYNGNSGLSLNQSSGVNVQGGTFISNTNAGLYLNQSTGVNMSGINSYSNGTGVVIEGGGSNILTGSYIGYNKTPGADNSGNRPDSPGMPSKYGNKGYGVLILSSTGNTIGVVGDKVDINSQDRNTISGNGLAGVGVVNASDTNQIVNNTLGLTPPVPGSNQRALGNLYGVYVENSNSTSVVNNQIGGNGRYGVYVLNSTNADVRKNTVGDSQSANPNRDGNYAKGNFGDGIYVSDSDNVLITQNVIVGNAYPVRKKDQVFVNPNYPRPNSKRTYRQSFLANGIHLSGRKTRGTRIIGNRIGLTAAGRTIPNQAFAILIDTGATFRVMTNNLFRTNPNYAPYTPVYDLTRLGLRA